MLKLAKVEGLYLGLPLLAWLFTLQLMVLLLVRLPQPTKLMLRLVWPPCLVLLPIQQPYSGYCLPGDNVAQSSGQFWSSNVPAPRRPWQGADQETSPCFLSCCPSPCHIHIPSTHPSWTGAIISIITFVQRAVLETTRKYKSPCWKKE